MITRTFLTCVFVVFCIFFIFCLTSPNDGKHNLASPQGESHLAQQAVDGNTSDNVARPFDPSGFHKPKFKRSFRDLPVMNIPPGFFVVAVPLLLMLMVYVVGLILNDISLEKPEDVERLFGKLNK